MDFIAIPVTATVKEGDELFALALTNGDTTLAKVRANNPSKVCADAVVDGDGFCLDDTGKKRHTSGDLIYPGDKVVVGIFWISNDFSYVTKGEFDKVMQSLEVHNK